MLGNMRHHLCKLARILSPKYLRLMEERASQIPGKMHPCLLAPALGQRWLGWSSWMCGGKGHGEWKRNAYKQRSEFWIAKKMASPLYVTSSPREPISRETK